MPIDRLLSLEMEGLAKTAEAVARAALKRQKSLGNHWRIDEKTDQTDITIFGTRE
jgi:succinate dehydrogenase/fumarate reductase flavoprotein subunit